MDLQPLGDRLIVEVLEEEETTTSGIVLPDTAKEKPQRGNVLAVGPGSRNDEGNIIPMEIAEGDEIIFSKYGGTEVKLGSDDVLILRESDVLACVLLPGAGADGEDASPLRLLLRGVRKDDAAHRRLLLFEDLDDQAVSQRL